jgi:hypothetical protein
MKRWTDHLQKALMEAVRASKSGPAARCDETGIEISSLRKHPRRDSGRPRRKEQAVYQDYELQNA